MPVAPGDTDHPSKSRTALDAASSLASPNALAAPAAMAAAPSPLPDPEPAPPERDPVAAWTGPVPALEPPGLFSPPAVQKISEVMEATARVERVGLLATSGGRYRSGTVGDALDGWRVSMIGADAVRITRGGEDRTFLLVNR